MVFPFAGLAAIGVNAVRGELTEGPFVGRELLKRFRDKQEFEDGGLQIQAPRYGIDDTGTTGAPYSPRDALSLDEYDGVTASLHDWKYNQETLVLYKPDLGKSSGKRAQLKYLDVKMRLMKRAWEQKLIKQILSDGTANTGVLNANQMIGIRAVIATSGSYGSINSSDDASWASTVDSNSDVDRTLTQAIIDKAFDQGHDGSGNGPSLFLMDKSVFTKFRGLLTPFQQTQRESSIGGLGQKSQVVVYNGVDWLVENLMPGKTIIGIDEENFKLVVDPKNNMRVEKHDSLETLDAMLIRQFLYANTIGFERKFHVQIDDISV